LLAIFFSSTESAAISFEGLNSTELNQTNLTLANGILKCLRLLKNESVNQTNSARWIACMRMISRDSLNETNQINDLILNSSISARFLHDSQNLTREKRQFFNSNDPRFGPFGRRSFESFNFFQPKFGFRSFGLDFQSNFGSPRSRFGEGIDQRPFNSRFGEGSDQRTFGSRFGEGSGRAEPDRFGERRPIDSRFGDRKDNLEDRHFEGTDRGKNVIVNGGVVNIVGKNRPTNIDNNVIAVGSGSASINNNNIASGSGVANVASINNNNVAHGNGNGQTSINNNNIASGRGGPKNLVAINNNNVAQDGSTEINNNNAVSGSALDINNNNVN